MTKVRLLVSVDDEHLNRFSEVVNDVEAAGMQVEQTMEDLGALVGSIEPAQVETLRQVEGVSSVEESRQFQIPPPDSEVQ